MAKREPTSDRKGDDNRLGAEVPGCVTANLIDHVVAALLQPFGAARQLSAELVFNAQVGQVETNVRPVLLRRMCCHRVPIVRYIVHLSSWKRTRHRAEEGGTGECTECRNMMDTSSPSPCNRSLKNRQDSIISRTPNVINYTPSIIELRFIGVSPNC